jgi:hypothetical protein
MAMVRAPIVTPSATYKPESSWFVGLSCYYCCVLVRCFFLAPLLMLLMLLMLL